MWWGGNGVPTSDVVLTKKVWQRIQKISLLKQLPTHFKAKREKGVGTPFSRIPAPLPPDPHTFFMFCFKMSLKLLGNG